jgi:excisionase family DNA binding protein
MREMLREGRMPSYKIEGARRIDATDVDRYLAAHRE